VALVIYALGVQEVKKMDEMIFSQENLPKLKKHYKEICILWAEYKKIEQPALAEYKKIRQLALAEYKKIEQLAWAEYEKIRQPALAEYKKIEQPALAEYEKIEQPAWAEYQRKKDEALEVFLEKIRMLIKDDTKKG